MKTIARKISCTEEFDAFFHQPTFHPMVSVGDLGCADLSLFQQTDFDMYGVVLMDAQCGVLKKNGKDVSYRAGTVFTVMPGQVVEISASPSDEENPDDILLTDGGTEASPEQNAGGLRGWMLAFRPELLVKTGLGRDFYMFNFFGYDVREALVLSSRERGILLNCFANIYAELRTPDDHLTGHMLRLGIGQLLSYCKRFYERQFDADRHTKNDMVQRLSAMLDNYLSSGLPEQKGQPTVGWCAEQFGWSANYFGEVVKRELHITAQEYVQGKIVDAAKIMLTDTNMSVTEIAQQLGFAYPNHFTRLFCRKVGLSPTKYRMRM